MEIVNLTDAERHRFVLWLKNEIESDDGIIKKMEKINTPEMILKRYKMHMGAKVIVANILETTETMGIE